MTTCRFCRSMAGSIVLDLGSQPSSELFPCFEDAAPDPTYPLRMWLCDECNLAQLADDIDVPERPVGSEPAAVTGQRQDAVHVLLDAGILPRGSTVTEFSSPHGGSWLAMLADHGLTAAPAGEPADVVVDGCFGLMHEPDQLAALRRRAEALRPGGVLVVQYHSLAAMLDHAQWNALRLGHFAYYSTPAMVGMLARVGLTVTTAHRFPLYGSTVLLTASTQARAGDSPAREICEQEIACGVRSPAVVAGLQASAAQTSERLRKLLQQHQERGRRVYGYGAASRAVALLRLADLDAALLPGVADAAPAKQGCRMPGTDIPIISPDELVTAEPDTVLVFVDELVEEARRALPRIEEAGGRWVSVGAGG